MACKLRYLNFVKEKIKIWQIHTSADFYTQEPAWVFLQNIGD
jgi:hypothetical protein